MSLDGFQLYLCSQEGSIFNVEHRDLYQDMSQPLSHYFLSSSHNTYLMEDQLRGQSSVEGYIRYPTLDSLPNTFSFTLRSLSQDVGVRTGSLVHQC